MVEDIKSLTKKNTDLEKRLKVAEAKIKSLADSMTDPKRIEKFISVVNKEQTNVEKRTKREMDLQDNAFEARRKEDRKERDKEDAKRDKEFVKYRQHEEIKSRLTTLEQLVHAVLAGK